MVGKFSIFFPLEVELDKQTTLLSLINFYHFPNRFSFRGSYFKYTGEGSQISWIRFGGAVEQGVVRVVL